MIKIEIRDTEVKHRSGNKKETGEYWEKHFQVAALHTGDSFPVPFELRLDSKMPKPYPAGFYTFAPESFRINRYGSPELSAFDMALIPYPEAKK